MTARGAFLAVAFALQGAGAGAATLTVVMEGVKDGQGTMRVMVCTRETFGGKHCAIGKATPAVEGETTVAIDDVPPGNYAVQVFQDRDGTGRPRRGLFGIPEGEFGFSRNAVPVLGPPFFDDAVFPVEEPSTEIRLRMRHVGR